jgi:hypothetical protein
VKVATENAISCLNRKIIVGLPTMAMYWAKKLSLHDQKILVRIDQNEEKLRNIRQQVEHLIKTRKTT